MSWLNFLPPGTSRFLPYFSKGLCSYWNNAESLLGWSRIASYITPLRSLNEFSRICLNSYFTDISYSYPFVSHNRRLYTHTTLIIPNSSGSCYLTGSTEFCEIPWYFMMFYWIPLEFHEVLQGSMGFHNVLLGFMRFHGVSWCSIGFHEIPWSSMMFLWTMWTKVYSLRPIEV
jgi:hypothetical protein